LIQTHGIKFESTVNGTPAQIVGLSGVIQNVNGEQISNVRDLAVELSKIKPHETINITTDTGIFYLTTAQNPANETVAYLGISNARNVYVYKFGGYVPDYVLSSLNVWSSLLFWILLLSIGVGVVNMLPIKPLDGGLMFQEIFDRFFKTNANVVGRIVSIILIGLIVFNLIGVWLLNVLAL
jgi:membrane-associated protease RseP (regulator of RpoE activity)